MLASLFFIAALLSFHPEDESLLVSLSWNDISSSAAKETARSIGNPFGLLGARLSAFFVRSFFGYPAVLPGIALLVWGWSLFRHRSLKPALLFFLYMLFMAIDIATMSGLTSMPFSDYLAGTIGRMFAAMLSTLIGMTGAWIFLVAAAAVTTFYISRTLGNLFSDTRQSFGEVFRRPVGIVRAWFERRASRKADRLRIKEENKLRKDEKKRKKNVSKTVSEPVQPNKNLMADDALGSGDHLKVFSDEHAEAPPLQPVVEPVIQAGIAGEPEMIITAGVHEKEADLDERRLKVKTKDREPYRFPSIDLLERVAEDDNSIDERHLAESKRKLLEKLNIYKIDVVRISTTVGPRVTLFEMELAPDVKISRVKSLENDLAMALAARGIRIIAPIPGKNAVGVEIPNSKPKTVWLRSVLQVEKFKNSTMTLPIVLGKTIANEVFIADLALMPHLLIAGATGAGKSVCINVIISSLLYACRPDKVKFVMIDPKRVELFHYQHLKNHFLLKFPGIDEQIITEPQKAVYALRCVVKEMEARYESLEKAGVRNIGDYNRRLPDEALPYLVVVIDELADLMITAGREVEEPIIRIAQLARAVGIHLIVATQRPSVDVITGIIKANFPARIAFQVASKVDSRTILDGSGAEQLLGNGDMLYQPSDQPKSMRIQAPYVSSHEVEQITRFIGSQEALKNIYMLPAAEMQKGGSMSAGGIQDRDGRDAMFEEAARLVVMHQQASVSLLQRRLRLGFSRAGRVMDQLADARIVSHADGSKPRDVLVADEDALEVLLRNPD
ncbi:DNA translocase FtsK [Chlorobium sp.]|uniref:DNA translocase FtsK n=1 Tax=Chlorobium sp. TaxID=1095 RepID=UPI003FA527F4